MRTSSSLGFQTVKTLYASGYKKMLRFQERTHVKKKSTLHAIREDCVKKETAWLILINILRKQNILLQIPVSKLVISLLVNFCIHLMWLPLITLWNRVTMIKYFARSWNKKVLYFSVILCCDGQKGTPPRFLHFSKIYCMIFLIKLFQHFFCLLILQWYFLLMIFPRETKN